MDISKRFPFFRKERDIFLSEVIEFCDKQESNLKVFQAIIQNERLIKENYELMQLYSPTLSIQTKHNVDWVIKEFGFSAERKSSSSGFSTLNKRS